MYKPVSAWKRQPVQVLSLFGNIEKGECPLVSQMTLKKPVMQEGRGGGVGVGRRSSECSGVLCLAVRLPLGIRDVEQGLRIECPSTFFLRLLELRELSISERV